MMAAPRAILLQLDAIRSVPPVLPTVVVPALALVASQRYQLSHNLPPNHRRRRVAAPSNGALLHNLRDDASPHGPATLPDGEVQPLVHGNRTDQLHVHYRVVPRHHHLHALFQPYLPRYVRRAEVELRSVVREERCVSPSLFLRKHVNFCLESSVRGDGPWLGQYLPTLYVIALDPTQECSYVVPRLR